MASDAPVLKPGMCDITGTHYGALVAIKFAGRLGTRTRWTCKCECGSVRNYDLGNLRSGYSRRCRHCPKRLTKYDLIRSPEYGAWRNMIQRCGRPKHPAYHRYGGRGIKVCERWRESFDLFLADVGYRPSPLLSLDRIDNDGNYEPGNVRWATMSQQQANRSDSSRLFTCQGKTLTAREWAVELGVSRQRVHQLLAKHPPEIALLPRAERIRQANERRSMRRVEREQARQQRRDAKNAARQQCRGLSHRHRKLRREMMALVFAGDTQAVADQFCVTTVTVRAALRQFAAA